MDPVAELLARLERGELGNPDTVLAYVAGNEVGLPGEELNEARRRALLLLAAGGDPRRELGGRLAAGLDALALRSRDLPHVRDAVLVLAGDLDLAWRLYALSLLAEELGEEG
jgi:hypothetical protein